MGAFDPSIAVYEEDGTTLVEVVTNCLGFNFAQGARKGMLGGEVKVSGHARNSFRYSQGQIFKFFYEDGEPLYCGRVDGPGRRVEGQDHIYTLRSLYADLETVDMSERVTLGTGGESGTGTIGGAIEWLFTNRIAPDTILTLGTHDCTMTLTNLLLDPGADLPRIFEQLELAAGSDGQTWVSGIAPDLSFYFIPVPAATAVTPVDFEIGANLLTGNDKLEGRFVSNHLGVLGKIGTTPNGEQRTFKKIYDSSAGGQWAASEAAWNRSRIRYAATNFKSEADMTRFATGHVSRYGVPYLKLESVMRPHSGTLETGSRPVFPHEARGRYTDTQRGPLAEPDVISVLDFSYGSEGLLSRATIGLQADPTADYAPDRERDLIEDTVASTNLDNESLPEATDLTDAPDGSPTGGGSGSGGNLLGIGWLRAAS